jgi:hypothetical protein
MQEKGEEDMALWRKVDERMWGDAKFLSMSRLHASGQALWLYLLTGPHNAGIPGLYNIGRLGTAEALGWEIEDFDRCWAEIESRGMARSDWANRVVFIANALRYNEPDNPNQVRGWLTRLDSFPECELTHEWCSILFDQLVSNDRQDWTGAFPPNRHPKGLTNPFSNSSRNSSANSKSKSKSKSKSRSKSEREEESVASEDDSLRSETKEERDSKKLEEFNDWISCLMREAEKSKTPKHIVSEYLGAMISALAATYDGDRDRVTPTRKMLLARGLARFPFDVQLAAIEIFVDKYSGKQEGKYLVGIARRFDRLTSKEQEREMRRHRGAFKGGLYDETTIG